MLSITTTAILGLAKVVQNEYREHHMSYVVFVTEPTDRQSQRRRAMEVNAVIPAVPRYMYWSEQEISWSRKDHPKVMPNPGGYALVLDPTLVGPSHNVKFTKVLIDDGSSLNILYKDTMHQAGYHREHAQPQQDHLPWHSARCIVLTRGQHLD